MRIIAVMAIVCVLVSCKKYNNVSECIQSKIEAFKKSETLCTGAAVKEYSFQGKVVYVFETVTCIADGGADVYDSNCNYLGTIGGFTGNVNIGGVDFGKNARYRATIWSNH
ncbi:MAG: DUF6970 domain-containing protein [Flavisolibacter sp.]